VPILPWIGVVLLGSWPLTVYLSHEPILAGLIWSFGKLFG
jgi:uncharacterized membrane protein